jgi:hypothetical protein
MAKDQMKKLTILVPQDLLRRAQRATKAGATPTVRKGLELLAAHGAYDGLRKMRGKVRLGLTWQEMRGDE